MNRSLVLKKSVIFGEWEVCHTLDAPLFFLYVTELTNFFCIFRGLSVLYVVLIFETVLNRRHPCWCLKIAACPYNGMILVFGLKFPSKKLFPLKLKVENLASSLKFPLKKLLVVDGSTRSNHSNFLDVGPELENNYSEVIAPQDVATYDGLCALASFDRMELKAYTCCFSFLTNFDYKNLHDSSLIIRPQGLDDCLWSSPRKGKKEV